MGLVLTLKPGKSIYVGDTKIQIAAERNLHKDRKRKPVKLFFEGPDEVEILRGELVEGEDGARPKTTRRHR